MSRQDKQENTIINTVTEYPASIKNSCDNARLNRAQIPVDIATIYMEILTNLESLM